MAFLQQSYNSKVAIDIKNVNKEALISAMRKSEMRVHGAR